MFSNILGGAAGFPVADLGDEISKSIRFPTNNGSERLEWATGPSATTSWAVSFWMKLGQVGQATDGTIWQASGASSGPGLYINHNSAAGADMGVLRDPNNGYSSGRSLRDPSAWYHVVHTFHASGGTNRVRIYINGETALDTTGVGAAIDPGKFRIGGNAQWPQPQFQGYMAEWHFVSNNGNLTADDFGRTNDDGIWVPKTYTGSHGSDGFHLDFADGSDLGNDVSGNNNDFTATGFDTADVVLYSAQTTATNGGFNASFPATNMFDGSLGTMALAASSNGVITFEPSTAIAFTNGVHMNVNHTAGDPGEFRVTVDGTTGTFTTFPTPANSSTALVNQIATGSGNLEKIEVRRTGVDNPAVVAIGINGTATSNILVDNIDNDVDYLDTPTSNYSTYNPLVNNDEPTFNQANLDGDVFNNGIAWATQELPDEHLYCEFIRTAGDLFAAGVWDAEDRFEKGAANDNDYAFGIVYSEFQNNPRIFNENTTATQTGLTAYSTGDVLGVEWRGDLATRQVNFYINGTQVGTSENVAAGGRYYFGVDRAGGSTGPSVQVNFGQMPFLAAPTGVSNTTHGMQTNNLPEPTIKNGKEHFEAKLYSGTGSSNAITGLEFSPDLIWIKVRDAADNHVLVDTIRGTDSVLFSNSNDAPASSFSRFTSFDSNGFTVDTTDTSWNNSANDYVAWCWKAGGTAVSNTDGTITSSVSANTTAGFSIVGYQGNGSTGTVGHGLNSAPEFVIQKNRDQDSNWLVYHKDLGKSHTNFPNWLYLNTQNAEQNSVSSSNHPFTNDPDNSVLNLGTGTSELTNVNGEDHIAYCWHSVEGFSKIGSFSGNADADGPFIYLGFRPSFFLWKRTDSTGSWGMIDSTRNTHNPLGQQLFPNTTDSEATYTICDFLSNGIKMRNSFGDTNTGTIAFLAFAENPFGGENAAPATAR